MPDGSVASKTRCSTCAKRKYALSRLLGQGFWFKYLYYLAVTGHGKAAIRSQSREDYWHYPGKILRFGRGDDGVSQLTTVCWMK